jgi:PAS domain-containing protein
MSMEAIGRKSCSARHGQAQSGFPCSDREVSALTRIEPAFQPDDPSRSGSSLFCSRCGAVSPEATRRVCDRCEEGILLSCKREALPGDAFVVCTYELVMTAISDAGEQIFGKQETVLGARLLDLATCPLGDDQLARHTALAAQRPREPVVLPLRLRSERGASLGMLAARVTTCGPPRAALVSVEQTGFGRR